MEKIKQGRGVAEASWSGGGGGGSPMVAKLQFKIEG